MALTDRQLGIVVRDRGRLAEAEDRYRKALTIKKELGNHIPGAMLDSHGRTFWPGARGA